MNVTTTLIPALAIAATTGMYITTLWHQQRTGEHARLRERRVELYVDLLRHQHPYLAAPDMDPNPQAHFGPQTPEERALLEHLSARADAFASEPFAERRREVVARVHDMRLEAFDVQNGDATSPDEKSELLRLEQTRDSAREVLRARIRAELKTGK